ncbi:ATP-binding cassette domain-containing protein [Desertihabitans brevis]|uniref:ATP-binding cassette domain-containing protein n=1 Tax=Desertihabitans brevis TaxID=2268447 RepID=A0A367YXX4_9ACTN|nr:ATP-binding cassette domain-containing protein [Desertihabitans brevis]RCK70678.1 ATP-binding cassette domain-containing protein [Desertihabitans brevis]
MTVPGAVVEVDRLVREFTVREPVPGRRLRRRARRVRAVDEMTFTVGPGEAVGYIGANGAGKSTTIKMLAGILVPTSGSVRTCGLEPIGERRTLSRRIGVVFGQRSQLWWDLPLSESFAILGAIHRLEPDALASRRAELVEELELADFWSTPVRQLSLGQRRRAEVAAALLHRPELVVLDEPTIGLDVLSKQRLREFLVHERRTRGTTLLLTTHDMGDVERLCERVLVVDHGRLAYDGTLSGLGATVAAERILVVDLAEPVADLQVPGTRHLGSEGEGVRQRLAFDPATTTAAAVLTAVQTRAEVRDLSVAEPDVEDVVRRLWARNRAVGAGGRPGSA